MMHHYHRQPMAPYHPHPPHLYYHGHWPCDAGHPEPEVDHDCGNDVDDDARYGHYDDTYLAMMKRENLVCRDLAYAEADYIYNSVTRKLPAVPASATLQSQQKRQEIEALVRSREAARKESGLTRSSSTVVRTTGSLGRPGPTYFNSLNRKERKLRQRTPEKLMPQPPSPPETPMSNNSIKASVYAV